MDILLSLKKITFIKNLSHGLVSCIALYTIVTSNMGGKVFTKF